MSATVEIGGFKATITDGQWTSDNPALAQILTALLPTWGPSGADPNPDLHIAQNAVKQLGGTVLEYDETEFEEGVVY